MEVLKMKSFRLLAEYHSFLSADVVLDTMGAYVHYMFPSPCGVSFILIRVICSSLNDRNIYKFPSPCGVSFILINKKK